MFSRTRTWIHPWQHLLAAQHTTRLLFELSPRDLVSSCLSFASVFFSFLFFYVLFCHLQHQHSSVWLGFPLLPFPFSCALALMGLALVGAGPGQTRSDTSNTSMDSTDTATMHNSEGGHPAGTHSNPIPSSVLSKPGWTLPPQSPPQTGETATNSRPVKLQLIALSHFSRLFSFLPPQSPPQTGETATNRRPVKLQLIASSHISRMFSVTPNLRLQLSCPRRP